MSIDVRTASPSEYAVAGRITVGAYEHDGYLVLPAGGVDTKYALELSDALRRAREAELVVAVDGDEGVLGTVTWCPNGSVMREIARTDDEAEFRMLATDPEARGRGVGKALVSWCVDKARAEGRSRVLVSSLPEMAAAHRLYTGLGFTRDESRDWSPATGVELLAFSLALD